MEDKPPEMKIPEMKISEIQYISDIHLEFSRGKIPKIIPCCDTLVLAGDIGYPETPIYQLFLRQCSQLFKKVFIVAGNHEFYTHKKCLSMAATHQMIERLAIDNISYLNNSFEDYGGYRFVGSTLWAEIPEAPINDIKYIVEMTRPLYNSLHYKACKFIQSAVYSSDLPVIVVTHHPSFDRILPQKQIKLWIHGHVHDGYEKEIDGIKIVCNPWGYPSENKYRSKAVIFAKTVKI